MTGFAVAAAGAAAAGFGAFFSEAIKQQKAFQETFTLLPNMAKEVFGEDGAMRKRHGSSHECRMAGYVERHVQRHFCGYSRRQHYDIHGVQAAKAAIAGTATLNEAVNVGTTVLNAMTKQGLSTERAFDILFSTIRKGKTTLPELASSIGFYAPCCEFVQAVPLEQISAMISTLTASGIPTRVSMTSIRAGLGELADPAYKAGKALQEVDGQDVLINLIREGKNVGEIMEILV